MPVAGTYRFMVVRGRPVLWAGAIGQTSQAGSDLITAGCPELRQGALVNGASFFDKSIHSCAPFSCTRYPDSPTHACPREPAALLSFEYAASDPPHTVRPPPRLVLNGHRTIVRRLRTSSWAATDDRAPASGQGRGRLCFGRNLPRRYYLFPARVDNRTWPCHRDSREDQDRA